jgi:hypothetical protein
MKKLGEYSFVFPGSGGNTQSIVIKDWKGILSRVVIAMPNFTNSVTATLSFTNEDGYVMGSISSIPKNLPKSGPFIATPDLEFTGESVTVSLTLSGDPGGSGGTATAMFYITE